MTSLRAALVDDSDKVERYKLIKTGFNWNLTADFSISMLTLLVKDSKLIDSVVFR